MVASKTLTLRSGAQTLPSPPTLSTLYGLRSHGLYYGGSWHHPALPGGGSVLPQILLAPSQALICPCPHPLSHYPVHFLSPLHT